MLEIIYSVLSFQHKKNATTTISSIWLDFTWHVSVENVSFQFAVVKAGDGELYVRNQGAFQHLYIVYL